MKLALKNDAIDYNQGDKMIVLKIALIIVGLMSSLFGYFIYLNRSTISSTVLRTI